MTEIPEHLLKRSQAAKAKASGEAAPEAGGATPAAITPATTSASVPAVPAVAAAPARAGKAAPVAPPPPKPDSPVVAAAKSRKKIPFWAMATLSILPLWVFMYARSLTPVEQTVAGPLGDGAAVYTGQGACSGCHGAAGEGGTGYQFSAGEILKTFPIMEDQLRWVYAGTNAYQVAGVDVYGNPARPGTVHVTGATGIMPAQGATQGGGLTEAEILAVVCHERYTLGGADPTADYLAEYTKWCSPESEIYAGLEAGTYTFENLGEIEGTFPVGIVPAEGHAADAKP